MGPADAQIDREYWGNRLEVNVDLVAEKHADALYLEAWVRKLSKRSRLVLVRHFGLDEEAAPRQQQLQLLALPTMLFPVMLVAAAAAGKRRHAISEVARTRLPEADLHACKLPGGRLDRVGLMWLLFCNDPHNLELVFHLHRVQSRGFARMVLTAVPPGLGNSTEAFFTKGNIQRILDEHEHGARTRRRSVCSEILWEPDGNHRVFIKRDFKSSFVCHGAENTFGFEPEWMVLEFEPELFRVHVCSVSPDVPAILANRIASEYFGAQVSYENESIYTCARRVKQFLQSLVRDPHTLPLVELVTKNTGIVSAPVLRMSDRQNRSLAPALRHFASAFGDPLAYIEDIESLWVLRFQRRVKLVFEDGDSMQTYVVRYCDQPLTGDERRAFERMMLEVYGITVLSTEKRRAA